MVKMAAEISTSTNPNEERRLKYVWHNIILLACINLGGLYGFYLEQTNTKWQTLILWKLLCVLSAFGVTAGAHRLWSHRSYKANRPVQIILMFFKSLTYQNSIYVWCRDHRLHHKFSETDADPHNAKRGFFFSHMGWLMVRKHPEVLEKGKLIDMSDLQANSVVMFQHRYYYFLIILTSLSTTVLPWLLWGESLKVAFFTATLYRLCLSLHFTWGINSFAHLYGNKPYDKTIGPTENLYMSLFTWGEGFHNYHHTFPWDYKAAEFGNDVRNPTTMFIDFFAWIGWVKDRQYCSKDLVQKRIKRTGAEKSGEKSERTLLNNFVATFNYVLLIYLL